MAVRRSRSKRSRSRKPRRRRGGGFFLDYTTPSGKRWGAIKLASFDASLDIARKAARAWRRTHRGFRVADTYFSTRGYAGGGPIIGGRWVGPGRWSKSEAQALKKRGRRRKRSRTADVGV